MKQYTTPEQTAKLIELGFEKPKNALPIREENKALVYQLRYTIGELLSFLPKSIKVNNCYFTLTIIAKFDNWSVKYVDMSYGSQAYVYDVELIDALFTEILHFKEEGVI
ncbi:MAG: hypothetical protein IJF63_04895 [Alistipes sp.]|nr:hypothetical protein [Alistipes sp.]MBQ6862255.1 hypothetical protein [Alistipes sp.]